MADDIEIEELDEEVDESGDSPAPKKNKKKLIIIMAVLIVVLGGAAFFVIFSMFGGENASDADLANDPTLVSQTIYMDLDEFLVNLNNSDHQVNFLKMTVTLELPNRKTQSEIESNMEGNKRVQPEDIVNAYNFIANAIMLAKQPVLRHFMEEE